MKQYVELRELAEPGVSWEVCTLLARVPPKPSGRRLLTLDSGPWTPDSLLRAFLRWKSGTNLLKGVIAIFD
jgi:hypothetical protein